MCGIAGILKVHPPGSEVPPPDVAIPESWLDILDESIKHRGPDGKGRFRDRATRPDGSVVDVALVHRRLAIIDVACGQQPMVNEQGPNPDKPRNGRIAVVFNGCIYNHRELRRELQSAGHTFVTDHSDTEVLIHGWREWGYELISKLDGMFAAAIWDSESARLILTRDRFGEKPLYFDPHNKSQSFASCASALAELHKVAGDERGNFAPIDTRRLVGWLAFGWADQPPQRTIDAVQLGYESTLGQSDNSLLPLKKSVAMFRWERSRPRDRNIDSSEVDALIQSAVESRLESDVPIGVFLSGGIDSALITNYAAKAASGIEAFTVRMPTREFDESEAASETAKALGIRHHVLDCAASPAEDLIAAIRQIGLPFGDSSLLPSFWVSRAARRTVRVALGGDGGDELFLGYERQRALPALAMARRLPAFVRSAGSFLSKDAIASDARVKRRAARLLGAMSEASYDELLAIFPRAMCQELISSNVDRKLERHAGTFGMDRSDSSNEFVAAALAKDLIGYLPEDLLRKTDTASMSVALEVRAPFLAKELVDRMIRVRPDVLMPDGQRKGLLKAVARKYLPDEIVDRPKMGFSIPIGEWFRTDYGGMKQLLLDTLNSADPFPEGILGIRINRTFVAKMVEHHMDRRRDHSQRLYMLLVLAIWTDWLRGLSGSARS